jgi:hypothetical protein
MQEAIVGEKARREKGKVDKKPNIRYFYKYGMLPIRRLNLTVFK